MTYRKPIDPPDPGCSNVVECALADPDPLALLLLLVAGSVVLLFVTLAVAHIAGARSLLEEERSRVATEARAFADFARQVADVDVSTQPVTDGGPTVTSTLGRTGPDDGLDEVRAAYRDTVMSVPHYEAEYDESLPTNMRLEFGEDVANAVEDGGALTPQLKGTLVERSRTAHRQRVDLLGQLEGESEALDDAEGALRRCRRSASRIENADLEAQPFDDLVVEWRLLEDRKETAEAVLADRQETIQERSRRSGTRTRSGPSLEEYLYDPLSATYPVLAEATSLVERIEAAQQRIERALSSRT